jgi:TM2 domain-containing membrane protein YozV
MAYCTGCGLVLGPSGTCPRCGVLTTTSATDAGIPANWGVGSPAPSGKKVPAGVLGILLGGLGIHKFVLGYTKAGIIMLVIAFFSCGVVSSIIGLIEGIIYLTKSDREFDATYVVGRKEWF